MISMVRKYQRGIALIQVLIIAIVLTMLGIFINQSIREQVHVTSYIQGNLQVDLLLESIEAELLHSLLSHKRYKNDESDDVYVKNWNFFGKTFSPKAGVSIELQDLSGLLSLNYFNSNVALRLFQQLGREEADIRVFFDSLKDWKDADDLKHLNGAESDYYQELGLQRPRNGYLQSVEEVINVRGGDILTINQWQKFFSISLVSKFNPMNAPDEVLRAFLDNDGIWQQILELRKSNQLTLLSFYKLAGIEEDEAITFSTGKLIRIKIAVETESNQLSKSFLVELRPNSTKRPVIFSNVRWNEM